MTDSLCRTRKLADSFILCGYGQTDITCSTMCTCYETCFVIPCLIQINEKADKKIEMVITLSKYLSVGQLDQFK